MAEANRAVTPEPALGPSDAATLLGRAGGLKGGAARMAMLSPVERSALARKAAQARWSHESDKPKRKEKTMAKFKSHWTKAEKRAVYRAVEAYKAAVPDWKTRARDRKRKDFWKPLVSELGRPGQSVHSIFVTCLANGKYVPPSTPKKTMSAKAFRARGYRPYKRTKAQVEASRAVGKARWDGIRTRLSAYGLTEDQIAVALSGRAPKLTRGSIELIESRLLKSKTLTVDFEVAPDGVTVNAYLKPVALLYPTTTTPATLFPAESREVVAS